MSGILNIGTRALLTNQAVLQTAGNNIANVNTPGYSRQSVVLNSVAGQFSGSGYYGKGVEAVTVQRVYSEFLTRQATIAGSISAADTKRLEQLKQLEDIFQGGTTGLGAAVSDMLNAFSDVVSAPTDLSARSVVLARADEMAARFRAASSRLSDLRQGVASELKDSVSAVNSLAQRIAKANDEIARALGTGQAPNDLMDQRDQLIRDLNQHVQTSTIPADDGSLNIFLAGSQPLVLGTTVTPVSLKLTDEFGDPSKSKLVMQRGGTDVVLEEATLGGGKMAGLLRFKNEDLVDATNLLGRMALAIGTATNEQHRLGVDLSGNTGGDFFNVNAIPNGLKAATNKTTATIGVSIQSATTLAASNYEINFTGATTGTITRVSDGTSTPFSTNSFQIDGLTITIVGDPTVGAPFPDPQPGDRFMITPFRDAASTISSAFSSPRALAMANPVAASPVDAFGNSNNRGTLAVASLAARSAPTPPLTLTPVTLTFTSPGTYTRSDDLTLTPRPYVPGQVIEYDLTTPGATGWSLTLKGNAVSDALGQDTFTIGPNTYPMLNAGNAESMLALRDVAMFDGAALTDGYASAMSQIGVRVQSAGFAAEVSGSIAKNIEKDRTSVAGVNLDEEAAKLLQYQQAYQASAKMLQIAQSIFDTLLQTVGR